MLCTIRPCLHPRPHLCPRPRPCPLPLPPPPSPLAEVTFGRPRSQAGKRESSLTKGYDALGMTQFHSMDAGEDMWRPQGERVQ